MARPPRRIHASVFRGDGTITPVEFLVTFGKHRPPIFTMIHSLNDHGKAAGAEFSKACCGEAIKLADEVSAWIAARGAAWRRAPASKLARPDGW